MSLIFSSEICFFGRDLNPIKQQRDPIQLSIAEKKDETFNKRKQKAKSLLERDWKGEKG